MGTVIKTNANRKYLNAVSEFVAFYISIERFLVCMAENTRYHHPKWKRCSCEQLCLQRNICFHQLWHRFAMHDDFIHVHLNLQMQIKSTNRFTQVLPRVVYGATHREMNHRQMKQCDTNSNTVEFSIAVLVMTTISTKTTMITTCHC